MLDSLQNIDRTVKRIERWLPRKRNAAAVDASSLSLLDFIAAASPWLDPPTHLMPVIEAIERAEREEVKLVISTPPQHGKTTVVLHALVWLLARNPAVRNAYVSYAATIAADKLALAEPIAERAGLEFVTQRADRWVTAQRGGVIATGIGGPLTGEPVDGLLIIDDYVKNRAEAESPTYRKRAWEWFTSTSLTRLHPGASVIVVATRWHPDDLAGRLIERGWRRINLPAIDADGKPLWPERRPLEWLQEIRRNVGEYDWASLYMGEPRRRGGTVFRSPTYYTELPSEYREATGIDLAYSKRTSADYSVAIRGRFDGERLYITEVWRGQVEARESAQALKTFPAPRYWYVGGQERGIVNLMRELGVDIIARPASADKFVRAQPAAAAWNDGRILVPETAPWLSDFLSEVMGFTGLGDEHDDQVDALGALWDGIGKAAPYQSLRVRSTRR